MSNTEQPKEVKLRIGVQCRDRRSQGRFLSGGLELIDMENDRKVWFGQKKIKKLIERERLVF